MKVIFATLILHFVSNISLAQSSPQDITKRFFEIYKLGDSDKALDYLFSNTTTNIYLYQFTETAE